MCTQLFLCNKFLTVKHWIKSIYVLGVPWWLSGLKIQHCHCCGTGRYCGGVGSIPGLGTPVCHGCGKKHKACMMFYFILWLNP